MLRTLLQQIKRHLQKADRAQPVTAKLPQPEQPYYTVLMAAPGDCYLIRRQTAQHCDPSGVSLFWTRGTSLINARFEYLGGRTWTGIDNVHGRLDDWAPEVLALGGMRDGNNV